MDWIVDRTKFRLIRKVAEGGMGSVYEAVQLGSEDFQKIVAVKTILDEYLKDREFVDMFIGEAKLVADLVHQNIVQVYSLGRSGNALYISMEYVHGVNLEEFLDHHGELGQQILVELVAFIISRVCLGLHYAHTKTDTGGQLLGVVHRDISPKNIMIDMQGVVKITDFGIAKAQNVMRNREGELLLGKIQYMSPEQANFETTDHRSDIFSLGIVMYELLSGRNVFNDPSTKRTLENVRHMSVPPIRQYNPNVPEEIDHILTKALERDRERRYQTADEFGFDLQYFMYRDRFGPTYQSLEAYLKEIFPHFRNPKVSRSLGVSARYRSVADTAVIHRDDESNVQEAEQVGSEDQTRVLRGSPPPSSASASAINFDHPRADSQPLDPGEDVPLDDHAAETES